MVVGTTATEPCATPRTSATQLRFGERLRHWRIRASFTQARLGSALQYSPALISRLEAGTRKASVAFARAADALLGTDGELAELAVLANADQPVADGPTDDLTRGGWVEVPLPSATPVLRELDVTGFADRAPRPTGLVCPQHGEVHCGAHDLARVREAARAPRLADAHSILAWLAVYDRLSVETTHVADALAHVERMALVVIDRTTAGPPRSREQMLHLAADLAAEAGRLRFNLRQHSSATVWLTQAMAWGAMSGNVPARFRALGTMSLLSLFENDVRSAARYAEIYRAAARGRRWGLAHGSLCSARAAACDGDHAAFERHVATAFRAMDRFDDRDRAEAPWLTGHEGVTYAYSTVSGGLRDLAVRTGVPTLVARGALTARIALDSARPAMRSTRLLLMLRYADCLARSGDHDGAVHTIAPVLEAARTNTSAMIQREFRSLQAALANPTCGLLDAATPVLV